MKPIIALIFLTLPLSLLSQHYAGKSKTQVKKELEKQIVKNDTLTITLNEVKNTLVYSYRDSKVKPVDFVYSFDQDSKCISEKVLAGCDSCYQKYLSSVLSQKKFNWKKINENQYISCYSDHLILELAPGPKDFSYTIFYVDWTKESYNMLIGVQ